MNWFVKRILIDRIIGSLFMLFAFGLAVPMALIKGVTWNKK